MKRKLISAVTALCLVLTLAACGSKNTSVPSADVAAEQQYTAEGWSYSDGLTDDGLWSGVTAGDLVTLPEYKGISIAAADVAVTDARTLFITGKAYGVTEVIAVDGLGRPLFQRQIVVAPSSAGTVRVWRGQETTEVTCGSTCAPAAPAGRGS